MHRESGITMPMRALNDEEDLLARVGIGAVTQARACFAVMSVQSENPGDGAASR
jgi:hypothetical protein